MNALSCLAIRWDLLIMLHPVDELDAAFSKYPDLWDARATSLITSAKLAKIEGVGAPLWASHISKGLKGATTLHTNELSNCEISQCSAAQFACASLNFNLVWFLCRNQWQTEQCAWSACKGDRECAQEQTVVWHYLCDPPTTHRGASEGMC
jgi:hypothetical protein